MLSTAMIVFGYLGYRDMGVGQFPEIDFPVVSVAITLQNTPSETMAADVKRHERLAHLRRNGCALVRDGRRRSWWGNVANKRRSAVPRHSEVTDPLARKICRDLGIPDP